MATRLSAREARKLLVLADASQPGSSHTPGKGRRPSRGTAPAVELDAALADPSATGAELEVPGAAAACWFELPFALVSKSNFRRSSDATREDWKRVQDFEAEVRRLGAKFRPPGWELGERAPAPVPSRPQVLCFMWGRTLLDAANLSKSILDALEGVLFHADSSARRVDQAVTRSGVDQRGFIAFAQLAPGSPMRDVLKVHHRLVELSCSAAGTAGPLSGEDA